MTDDKVEVVGWIRPPEDRVYTSRDYPKLVGDRAAIAADSEADWLEQYVDRLIATHDKVQLLLLVEAIRNELRSHAAMLRGLK